MGKRDETEKKTKKIKPKQQERTLDPCKVHAYGIAKEWVRTWMEEEFLRNPSILDETCRLKSVLNAIELAESDEQYEPEVRAVFAGISVDQVYSWFVQMLGTRHQHMTDVSPSTSVICVLL